MGAFTRVASSLLLLVPTACARGADAWQHVISNPEADSFDRGLAAIALAEQKGADLAGVPAALLATVELENSSLVPAARAALLALPAEALPEMMQCLAHGAGGDDLGSKSLEAAIVRHGVVVIPPLLDAMPAIGTSGASLFGGIVIAIGEPAAPPLAASLSAGERGVKAAWLLGSLGQRASGATDALLDSARGEDERLAIASIDALTRMNPEGWRIEAALVKLAAEPDPDRRAAAEEGLGRVLLQRARGLDASPPGERKRLALLRNAVALGPSSARAFAEGLWPEGSSAARFAGEALLGSAMRWSLEARMRIGSLEEIRNAETRLGRGQVRDRRTAALEIGRTGRRGARAIPALVHALEHEDWGLRFCAELALALIAVDFVRS